MPSKKESAQAVDSYENKAALYKKQAKEAVKKLYDPERLSRKTVGVFDKETLRTYMENPENYSRQLRNLSRFLYSRSQVYRRIINMNASMIDTNFRSVIPNIEINKKPNKSKTIKSYSETLKILDKMNLPSEMLKVYLKCWVEDVFFGVYYFYEDEGGIVLPLDPDYCQIIGVYPTGDFAFSFDTSYFTGKESELEMWGEPFISMVKEGNKSNASKWVQVPDEYAICLKINLEDYMTPLPPYITLFDSIINLEDLKEITAIADEQQIYKLLAYKVPLVTNTTTPDNFAVDLEVAAEYYKAASKSLPEYTDAILLPGLDLKEVSFDTDQASDVNKVENAAKNILKTSGHSMMADQEGTTAVLAALKADEEYAISSLLPQTQAWVNRFLMLHSNNPCKVKFLEVTKYTKEAFKESVIKDMNYGLPMITTLGILNGYSELDLISMATVNDYLGLSDLFKPLETAATRSKEDTRASEGTAGGRPVNETPTDESEDSQDKRDRNG